MDSTNPATGQTLGAVILREIEQAKHTVRSASIAAGIPHSTLDRKIRTGGRAFTFAELERLAFLLGYDRVSDLTRLAEDAA